MNALFSIKFSLILENIEKCDFAVVLVLVNAIFLLVTGLYFIISIVVEYQRIIWSQKKAVVEALFGASYLFLLLTQYFHYKL